MLLSEETHYRILKLVHQRPDATQRQLACELNVSLGKINYSLKNLISNGFIKPGRVNSGTRVNAYLLTAEGIDEMARLTMKFLKMKINEYRDLSQEIKELEIEAKKLGIARD